MLRRTLSCFAFRILSCAFKSKTTNSRHAIIVHRVYYYYVCGKSHNFEDSIRKLNLVVRQHRDNVDILQKFISFEDSTCQCFTNIAKTWIVCWLNFFFLFVALNEWDAPQLQVLEVNERSSLFYQFTCTLNSTIASAELHCCWNNIRGCVCIYINNSLAHEYLHNANISPFFCNGIFVLSNFNFTKMIFICVL